MRVKAPEATQVKLNFWSGPKVDMEKQPDVLSAANIQHVYVESQGTDHEWQTWRRALEDFAPRLFQDRKERT